MLSISIGALIAIVTLSFGGGALVMALACEAAHKKSAREMYNRLVEVEGDLR
jgi:hypothetical protein